MRKIIVTAGVIAGVGMIAATAFTQTPPARTPPLQYITTPLEGDAAREVRLQSVRCRPAAATPSTAIPATNGSRSRRAKFCSRSKGNRRG